MVNVIFSNDVWLAVTECGSEAGGCNFELVIANGKQDTSAMESSNFYLIRISIGSIIVTVFADSSLLDIFRIVLLRHLTFCRKFMRHLQTRPKVNVIFFFVCHPEVE